MMMNKIVLASALYLALVTATHAEISFAQELQQGCAKVKTYANQGKKFYDQKQYTKAIEQFKQQASWRGFCLLNEDESGVQMKQRDVELAFNNVGLSYAKLGKAQWARAWYLAYPESSMSQFNLKQLPTPQNTKQMTGKYIQHAGFGEWNTLTLQQNKNNYTIQYEGLYMGARSLIYGPNIGTFETTMPLSQTRKIYRVNDCNIDISFDFDAKLGRRALLKQSGDISGCGFGHNVSAEGIYLKVE